MKSRTVTPLVKPNVGIGITRGTSLPMGFIFSSGSGKANFTFQNDGNLVDYDENGNPLWASNTADNEQGGNGGRSCVFQDDGNLVVYDGNGNPLWASNTADAERGGNGGVLLAIQDDGNVVIYDAGNNPLWATNTNH